MNHVARRFSQSAVLFAGFFCVLLLCLNGLKGIIWCLFGKFRCWILDTYYAVQWLTDHHQSFFEVINWCPLENIHHLYEIENKTLQLKVSECLKIFGNYPSLCICWICCQLPHSVPCQSFLSPVYLSSLKTAAALLGLFSLNKNQFDPLELAVLSFSSSHLRFPFFIFFHDFLGTQSDFQ